MTTLSTLKTPSLSGRKSQLKTIPLERRREPNNPPETLILVYQSGSFLSYYTIVLVNTSLCRRDPKLQNEPFSLIIKTDEYQSLDQGPPT